MASMRASTLLRSLPRPGSVPRTLSISAAPFRLSPCVRTPSIVHPTASLRPSSRFYSTTPADDIKIYSFTEINSVSKSPKDQYIIDVREPQELKDQGRIPNAINLPLSTLQESLSLSNSAFKQKFDIPKPEKEKEVIFYCKAGVRSTNASQIAKEAGYQKIGNYKGSFDDWIASKGTVAKAA